MEGKSWITSKTIVAGYVATACGLAQLFGIAVGPEEQATIAAAVVGIATAVSGLMAVYGRYKATEKIK
jgi:ABC-type transport system involved in cytochrome c biogenesis permease component